MLFEEEHHWIILVVLTSTVICCYVYLQCLLPYFIKIFVRSEREESCF